MTKYTAQDFANARFAEHPSGRACVRRRVGGGRAWIESGAEWSDDEMAADGWVPVPTKPQITESRREAVLKGRMHQYRAGWINGFREAGGVIIPDPEPTNTERLAMLINESDPNRTALTFELAEYLDKAGVTAPTVKDN